MSTIAALPAGTILRSQKDEYKIIRVIGSGGFGITYLVSTKIRHGNISTTLLLAVKEHFVKDLCSRDTTTSCIKCFEHNSDRVEAARKDFIGEARRLRHICGLHRNIVQVNEVFEANGTAYYVMEYIDGESLADYVAKRGPLSSAETLGIMRPVIGAVATLHASCLTHLDIKPANIMLGREEDDSLRPVLIDFGLAKHYDADGNPTSTLNSRGYSLGYAPIEQYHGIETFSPAVDVYSLGATMFFCLTGKKPVAAEFMTPEWLGENIPAGVPEGLRRVLVKSLSERPANRPSDASVLLEMINGIGVPTDDDTIVADADDTIIADVDKTESVVTITPTPRPASPNKSNPDRVKASAERSGKKWLWIGLIFGVLIAMTFILIGRDGSSKQVAPEEVVIGKSLATDTIEGTDPDSLEEQQSLEDLWFYSSPSPKNTKEIGTKKVEIIINTPQTHATESEESNLAPDMQKRPEPPVFNILELSHTKYNNLDLAFRYAGKVRYISVDNWKRLLQSEKDTCDRLGVVIDEPQYAKAFLWSLYEEPGEYTWTEAVTRFGNSLPTKAQGDAIIVAAQTKGEPNPVGEAIKVFGGDSDPYWWYWTSTEYDSSLAWIVGMNYGGVDYSYKTGTIRVRAVAAVPGSSAM